MRTIKILLISLALCYSAFAEIVDKIAESGVDNIYYVAPGIYRSGQPDELDMKMLEDLGLRSVLNLREYHSDNDEAKGSALQLYHVRMAAGSIDDHDIIAALKVLKDAPKPVLIHCWHGSDRTGAVVAMYRIIFEEWDKEIAIDELLQPRYGHHRRIYANIPKYIRNADVQMLREQILAD